jgi:hypothetical protein
VKTTNEMGEERPAAGAEPSGQRLSEAQKRQQRSRSIAIAVALGALVALFYAVTIVKIGGNVIASRI